MAALLPSWRASKVAPLAALRDSAIDTSNAASVRTAVGTILGAASLGLMIGVTSFIDEPLDVFGT